MRQDYRITAGVALVCDGSVLQLQPFAKRVLGERPLQERDMHPLFLSPDFAAVWGRGNIFLLTGSRRLADAPQREQLLERFNRCQWGIPLAEDLEFLNDEKRCGGLALANWKAVQAAPVLRARGSDAIALRPPADIPLYGAYTNATVDRINNDILARIPLPEVRIVAVDTAAGGAPHVYTGAAGMPASLHGATDVVMLKIGARVTFKTNIFAVGVGGISNGQLGDILSITGDAGGARTVTVTVRLADTGAVVPVDAFPYVDPRGRSNVTRWQVPLKLGWARTFHGSQGLSVPCTVADLAGVEGLPCGAYTAIMRATTVPGTRVVGAKLAAFVVPRQCMEFLLDLMREKAPLIFQQYRRSALAFLTQGGNGDADRCPMTLSARVVKWALTDGVPPLASLRGMSTSAEHALAALASGALPAPHEDGSGADWQAQLRLALVGGWRRGASHAAINRGGRDGVAALLQRLRRLEDAEGDTTGHDATDTRVAALAASGEAEKEAEEEGGAAAETAGAGNEEDEEEDATSAEVRAFYERTGCGDAAGAVGGLQDLDVSSLFDTSDLMADHDLRPAPAASKPAKVVHSSTTLGAGRVAPLLAQREVGRVTMSSSATAGIAPEVKRPRRGGSPVASAPEPVGAPQGVARLTTVYAQHDNRRASGAAQQAFAVQQQARTPPGMLSATAAAGSSAYGGEERVRASLEAARKSGGWGATVQRSNR